MNKFEFDKCPGGYFILFFYSFMDKYNIFRPQSTTT